MKKTNKKLSLNSETVHVLDASQLKHVAGGHTNTCLDTACLCYPTYGPDCATVGYTQCFCSNARSNCGCVNTFGC